MNHAGVETYFWDLSFSFYSLDICFLKMVWPLIINAKSNPWQMKKKERKGIDKFKYEKIRGPSISIWSELLIATKPLFWGTSHGQRTLLFRRQKLWSCLTKEEKTLAVIKGTLFLLPGEYPEWRFQCITFASSTLAEGTPPVRIHFHSH